MKVRVTQTITPSFIPAVLSLTYVLEIIKSLIYWMIFSTMSGLFSSMDPQITMSLIMRKGVCAFLPSLEYNQ